MTQLAKRWISKSIRENLEVQREFGDPTSQSRNRPQEMKTCPECGREFKIKRNKMNAWMVHQKYCSEACRIKACNRRSRERAREARHRSASTEYEYTLNEETWKWEKKSHE